MEDRKYTKSISNQKMVYARENDPDDTMIVRSFYDDENFAMFGVKGIKSIHEMFYAILKLMCAEVDILKKNSNYVEDKQFEDIIRVWHSVAEKGRHLKPQIKKVGKKNNTDLNFIEILTNEGEWLKSAIHIGILVDGKFPKITLFQFRKRRSVIRCVPISFRDYEVIKVYKQSV